MKLFRSCISLLLVLAMLLGLVPATVLASNKAIVTNEQGNYEIIDEQGETTEVDDTWEEEHPYGMLALGHHQVIVEEGGETQVLTVHRLGGTVGKVSAVIQYAPAVVEKEDGGEDLAYAISPEDVRIEVEDPLPITAYQAWGEGPAPEPAGTGISARFGVDEVLGQCTVLSVNALNGAEDYEWFAYYAGNWLPVEDSNTPELPVGDEIEDLDYRCEYTVGGIRYCSDSYRGVVYEKPEPQVIPEAPADLELNPEKTYTEMDMSQGDSGSVWLFEVCFAEGETEKEIRITAPEDEIPELDEMATFTIVGNVGGEILQSLNTAMMTVSDNDGDKDPPAQFGFTVTEATFDKAEGTACLTVQRTGGLVNAMSMDWTLEDGTAVAGVDYAPVSGSLNFYGNETEQIIEIPLINDQVEDLTEKEFTVRLSNLKGNGTDASCITEEASVCTVRLYNSNTAEDLNLSSTLQNSAAGVDVSANLEVSEGAQVSNQVLSGAQTGGNLPVEDNSTVEWETEANPKLRMYQYNGGGKITFSGGDWTNTVQENLSISSDGEGTNSTKKSIENMGALYRSLSASVSGGAGLCHWWDRMWYGNNEYAYTYFQWDPYQNYNGYKDCSPKLTESGTKVHLSWYSPFSVSDSLPYKTGDGALTLGVAKNDSCPSEDNIDASASVTLTRRTFANDFKLNIYTANDPDTAAEVAKYGDSDYSNIIQSISITKGGTNGGKLYEGSTVQIQLGNTHLIPAAAYLVDAGGETVMTGIVSGNSATFNNIVQDPNGSYTFRLVLERSQDIKIDLSTSASITEDGSYVDSAFDAAYALLLENSETDTVTVGYTARNGSNFDSTVSEKTLSLSGRTLSGSIITLEKVANLQWINFNMPENDCFLLNGRSYKGNEKIPLDLSNIKTKSLQFYYYASAYKSLQRPMNATLDATAIYFDGNANGVIDGYFDRDTGSFVLDENSGDEFVAYPEDGDYAAPVFAPVVDEDGTVHQYFFRPYYTANPVSLEAPEGKENEKMQVMPAFITDVTDPESYTDLTEEQQQYRVIISGETSIKESESITTTGHSADNHAKYGAEASAYSYVDIPLGGDASPAKPVTSDQPDGRYTIDGRDCVVYEGYVYSYGANAPNNLEKALYEWTPDYRGNLLYPFADPAQIVIPHTMVCDDYLLQGTDLLNRYLGSFGDNDTFALMVCEQAKTTDEILAERNLRTATGDGEASLKETVTRGTVGSFPDPEHLSHTSSTVLSSQTADNSEYTEIDEVTVKTKPDIFAANGNIANIADVSTSGYTIAVSVGVPVSVGIVSHNTDTNSGANQGGGNQTGGNQGGGNQTGGNQTGGNQTGGSSGFWHRNKQKNWVENARYVGSRISEFVQAVKGKQGKSSFAKLYGKEMEKNNLHFASFDFNVTFSAVFIFKYNALDNEFKFEQCVFSVHCAFTLTLRYRFTPAPAFYVYSVISIEFGGQGGLNRLRVPECEDAVISDSNPLTLYTSPEEDQAGSYTFTADKKAFEIVFDGKLYVECFNFTDSNANGIYDPDEALGSAVSKDIFKPGKITGIGDPVTVEIKGWMDGFDIDPVVVKLTPIMESASDKTSVTIKRLAEIKSVKTDYAFSGFTFDVGGSIEIGGGVGMEALGLEIFGQASIGIVFTLFADAGADSFDWAVFDSFTLHLALGFRVALLFFHYEMDAISYTVGYDNELDDNGQLVVDKDGWYHSWGALGDKFGGTIEEFSLRHRSGEADDKIRSYVSLPNRSEVAVSSNGVMGAGADVPQFYAFDTNAEDFQVSGYGSGSNAFRLLQGGSLGYDYQIVTVDDRNYVVYTGANSDASAVDSTELWLSRLKETDDVYGFVNPIAESSDAVPYIPVEGDGTGDLEFHAWAEGEKIHVIWVSYADATGEAALAEGDASRQLQASARNTVVKHAVFDTADIEATGFGTPEILNSADVNAYYFQPQMAGGAAVVARSVPYSDEALEARMTQFRQYLTDTEEEVTEEQDPNEFIAANREFRLNYQRDLWSVYGGNSVLSVSVPGKELSNHTTYVSRAQAEDPASANEIITNLDMTEIDGVYYLSYVTQQDIFERDGEAYTDLATTYRFYLRTFTVDENDTVVWGEPYLLRTLVDREQNSENDGIYSAGALVTPYQSPNFGNLSFLSGRLGDSLKGSTESFRTAAAAEMEDFLLFEMNGDTYVIQEKSLKSITGNDGTDTHTGTLSPFFTAEQFYQGKGMDTAEARANGESIASGKGEVVIGADGDGNLAAVYTAPVSNTVNNAIYISYWDPGIGSWGDGVMLAMNHMDVYERAAAGDWSEEEIKAAYYDEAQGGGLDQFTFSNLQIALGRRQAEAGETTQTPEGEEIYNETTADAAEATPDSLKETLATLLPENGVTRAQIDTWYEDESTVSEETRAELRDQVGYTLSQRAETLDLEADNSAAAAELLILTQGTVQLLSQYEDQEGKITVGPAQDEDGSTVPSSTGIYAISYGKGDQQVGDVSLSFSEHNFSAGSVLDAYVSFVNVGDAAIRGSEDQPVKVRLMLSDDGAASEMAAWEIPHNISAGQKVALNTGTLHCAALPGDLNYGDYFYITVEEDAQYIEATGGEAYCYDSSSDPDYGYTFDMDIKSELGIENVKTSVFAVDKEGNPIIHISFDAANRGSLTAKDPWLQFSYAASYDEEGEAVYEPLDMTKSELYISRQQRIEEETPGLRSAGVNDLRQGIVMLQGTEIFDRKDYYITKEEQRAIMYQHYSPTPVAGWTKAGFAGQYYWYDADVYDSVADAYTAGFEAVDRWEYDAPAGLFYNSDNYHSVAEAKRAAEADCKAEYILTAEQYSLLSADEQAAWHKVTNTEDQTEYYVPTWLETYEDAWQAFQLALNELNNSLFSHFVRQVEAYVKVSPEMFNGPLSGNMNLRVELFSSDSATSYDGSTGLYTSTHEDEYDGVNNVAFASMEHTGFIIAANKVVLNHGMVHLLPVHIRTTAGETPRIQVMEVVEEGQEKQMNTLYFVPHEDGSAPNVLDGHLVVSPSSDSGTGIIHIIDESTNTTKAVTFKLEPADQYGINISRESTQIFRNADGSLSTGETEIDDWKFPALEDESWTELGYWINNTPLKNDVAVGIQGASVTFCTTAMELEFRHLGDISVSSNKFMPSTSDPGSTCDPQAGTVTVTGSNSDDYCSRVRFDGEMGTAHLVTVTVVGREAKIDMVRPIYTGSSTEPTSEPGAPFIYWSMTFPRYSYNTEPYYNQIPLTAYVYDPDGVANVEFISGAAPTDSSLKKISDDFWVYHLNVIQQDGSVPEAFMLRATDAGGHVTEHGIMTTDWFRVNADDPTQVTPKAHINAYVERDDGTQEFLYMLNSPTDHEADESIVVAKGENQDPLYFYIDAGDGYTDETVEVFYYQYRSDTGAFEEITSNHNMEKAVTVTENGCYLVRVEYEDGTWAQRMIRVECFEEAPTVSVTEAVRDGKIYLNWSAVKNSDSDGTLASVTVNGYELLTEQGLKYAGGSVALAFGGSYTLKVTDSRGMTAETTLKVEIPVSFPADAITVVDNWSADTLYHRGEVHLDISKLSGGAYDPTKITRDGEALPPTEYTGAYGYFRMAIDCPPEEFSVEDEILPQFDGIMWRNVSEGPVTGLSTGSHVIVVQSLYDQKNSDLIAWQCVTVQDRRIKITNIDSTPSLGTANQDGTVSASFEGGHTGQYEAAILPGKELSIADFKAAELTWKHAEADGTVTFDDLADGIWQLAVRAGYDDPEAYNSANADFWYGAVVSEPIVVGNSNAPLIDEALKAAQEAQLAAEKAASDARVAQAAAEEAARSAAADKTAAENAKLAAELARSQAEAAQLAAEESQTKAEEAQAAAEASNMDAAQEAAKAAAASKEAAQSASAAAGSAADAASAAKAAQDAQAAAEEAQASAEKAAAGSEINKESAEAAQAAAETAQSKAEEAQAASEAAQSAAEAAANAAESSNVEAAEEAAKSAASAKASAESAAAAAKSAAEAAESAIDAQAAQKAAEKAQAAAEEAQLAAETAQSKAEEAQKASEEAATSSAEDREGAEAAQKAAELARSQAEAAQLAAEEAQAKAEEAKLAAEASNVEAAQEAAKSAAASNEAAKSASAAAGSAADAAGAAKVAQDAQAAAEEAQLAAEDAAASAAEDKKAAESAKTSAELALAQAKTARTFAETAQSAAELAAAAAKEANVEAAEEAAASAASAKASAESAASAAASAKSAAESAREAQEAQARAEEAQRLAEEAAKKAKDEADRIARESELNLAKTVAIIELNELAQELQASAEEDYRAAITEAAKAWREILLAAADKEALAEALSEAKTVLNDLADKQCAAAVFSDVEHSAWYHEAVDFVLNEGMMNGTGNGSFAPNDALSRAMLVQILYNIEGKPAVETELEFSDVAEGAWYYDAVMWAAENGIVQGTGNGTFAPEQEISREQMVTVLYRYAGSPKVADAVLTFADGAEVSDWAVTAVAWAVENAVVQGVGENRFAPAGSTTRASAAQVMMNYFGK